MTDVLQNEVTSSTEPSDVDDALYDEVLDFFRANESWSGAARLMDDSGPAALVLREMRTLDTRDYEAWLSLYSPRSLYWVPLTEHIGDPRTEPSIHFDDRRRRADRVALIRTGHLHAQTPPSLTARLISSLECRDGDGAVADIHSTLVVHEQRLGRRQVYAGRQFHRVVRADDGAWRIKFRALLLVDREVSQGNITFVL